MAGYITLEEACQQTWDAVIVGSGPGGLAAALKLACWRRRVLVLDSGHSRTGMIQWSCNHPAFPDGISGLRLLQKTREQAVRKKAKILRAAAVSLRTVPGGGFGSSDVTTGGGAKCPPTHHTHQHHGQAWQCTAHGFELDVCPVYDKEDTGLIPVRRGCSAVAAGHGHGPGPLGPGPGPALPAGEGTGEDPPAPKAPHRSSIDLFTLDTLRCACVLLCTGVEDTILPVPGLGPDPLAGGHLRISPMSDGVTELNDVAVIGSGLYARQLAATLSCFARTVTLCTGGLLLQHEPPRGGVPVRVWQEEEEEDLAHEETEDVLLDLKEDSALQELGVRMCVHPIAHAAMQDRAGALWAMRSDGALQAQSEPGVPAPVVLVQNSTPHSHKITPVTALSPSDPTLTVSSPLPLTPCSTSIGRATSTKAGSGLSVAGSSATSSAPDLSELPANPAVRDWLLSQSVTLTAAQYAHAMAEGSTGSRAWPWAGPGPGQGQGQEVLPENEADAARTAWPQREERPGRCLAQGEGQGQGQGEDGDVEKLRDRGSGPNIVRYCLRFAPCPGGSSQCPVPPDLTVHELYSGLRPVPRSGLAQQVGATLTSTGHIQVHGHSMESSNIPGLYAAGDVTAGLAEMGVAMGEGSLAAAGIQGYLVRRDLACERAHPHAYPHTQAQAQAQERGGVSVEYRE